MKDEKKESLKCPACGIDNARNRITCQVCHERLIPNPARMSSPEKTTKGEKKSRKKKETLTTKEVHEVVGILEPTETFTDTEEAPPLTSPEPPQPVIKQRKPRRKRVKIVKENEPVFFVLTQGHLQAVHITYGTLKPIKRKELTITERNVLSIWNRNKDLINLN